MTVGELIHWLTDFHEDTRVSKWEIEIPCPTPEDPYNTHMIIGEEGESGH